MKKWISIINKRSLALLTLCLMMVASACTKDLNPNNLPDADPSQYEREKREGVIKILAIGNSFSEDAIESYLYELATEKNIKVIIGNMYIGGASLELHKQNVERNIPAYEYRKIGLDGEKVVYKNVSLDLAIQDEYWDYISFQQVSQNSGQLETIKNSLPVVFNYVKSKAKNAGVKYVYHQTWAYAQNSTHSGFANYNNDQLEMYKAIVNVSKEVKNIVPVDIIVPAGTAIQNGRTSVVEDNFTRDGYHLVIPLGRYTAACTWFETIFNTSVVGMKYRPEGVSAFEASIAQNAAHLAVLKPFEVTEMTDFQGGDGGPLLTPVLIDFGNAAKSPSWNQISSFTAGSKINLKDSANSYVGLSLTITERFNGINTDGAAETQAGFAMPENVSRRSFFGNSKAVFSGILTPQSVFVLSGLDKNLTYNMCFFGSRTAGGNRATKYTLTGTNSGDATINTASNKTETGCINNIQPDAEGKITVTVTSGEGNDTGQGFFYLNAAKLTSNN